MFRENDSFNSSTPNTLAPSNTLAERALQPQIVSSQALMVRGFLLTRLSLRLFNLPPCFAGFRLLQMSDFHYGPTTAAEHLRTAVELAGELAPDMILFTGDYLQLSRLELRSLYLQKASSRLLRSAKHRRAVREYAQGLAEIISPLQAKEGIIGVFGNHDRMEGMPIIRRALERQVRFLQNETHAVVRDGHALMFGGIDDWRYGKPCLDSSLDFSAFATRSSAVARFLLSHNPDVVLSPRKERLLEVDLMLSGHTHGGQICLPILGPVVTRTVQKKHVRGLSWFGRTPIYVSNGLGFGGIALRTLCPPELVEITLNAAIA